MTSLKIIILLICAQFWLQSERNECLSLVKTNSKLNRDTLIITCFDTQILIKKKDFKIEIDSSTSKLLNLWSICANRKCIAQQLEKQSSFLWGIEVSELSKILGKPDYIRATDSYYYFLEHCNRPIGEALKFRVVLMINDPNIVFSALINSD